MKTTKKQITKVLLDPRVHYSLDFGRKSVQLKRNEYKYNSLYCEILDEVIEDFDKILFLIAQLNLEEEEKNK